MNLIWEQVSKKEILKTRVFTVTERTNKSPDGKEGIYIVNEAPDWVIIIPEDKEDFLMVTQYRHGENKLSTEFPGGVIDQGEVPEVAAARELREETGATGTLEYLGKMNPNPALFSNHVHFFYATNLVFTNKQDLDEDEFVEYKRIPKKEVIFKMGTEEYSHALMSSALGLYLSKKYC